VQPEPDGSGLEAQDSVSSPLGPSSSHEWEVSELSTSGQHPLSDRVAKKGRSIRRLVLTARERRWAAAPGLWVATEARTRGAGSDVPVELARNAFRPLRLTFVAVAVFSGAITLAVATVPGLYFAYRQPPVHIALETAASLIALLAAFLVFGRVQRTARLDEVVLAAALGLLALSNLLFAAIPTMLESIPEERSVWAAITGRTLGAILLATAPFLPRRRLDPRRATRAAVAVVLVAVVLTAIVVTVLRDRLPGGVEVSFTPGSAAQPDFSAHPAILAIQLAAAALYAVAAIGFLRRAQRTGDDLAGWIAVAAVLAAFSRVNYFLYPSLYSQWVYTGDAFRLAFYVVLLIGIAREIVMYWRALASVAVLQERRRIARELHDGLAQEIAYIRRNLASLGRGDDARLIAGLRRAADRAHQESRRAVVVLATPSDEPLEVALAQATREVADRYGVEVDFDLCPDVRLPSIRSEGLLRIACEAVANAARHSGARTIDVVLQREAESLRLSIVDRGRGFDPTEPTAGFGLISMRERARAIGAELRVESRSGRGTHVEVAV
jgi:signal transduction histidine kinase